MPTIFLLIGFIALISLIVGLIRPAVFSPIFKRTLSRTKLSGIFLGVFIVSFIGIGITAPSVERAATNNEAFTETQSEAVVPPVETTTGDEQSETTEDDSVKPEGTNTTYLVASVIDGDTIKVVIDGKTESVRLIGIDAPESGDCFSSEATNRVKELINGQQVYLEADPTQGDRDKYSRLLRYAFLDEGVDIAAHLIGEGYALEYTYNKPYDYQQEYKAAEVDAKAAKRGFWADGACSTGNTEGVTSNTQSSEPAVESVVPVSQTSDDVSPSETTGASDCYCDSNTYNCSNFSTHVEAQALYECCMVQVGRDVHGLDGNDDDGLACESLP